MTELKTIIIKWLLAQIFIIPFGAIIIGKKKVVLAIDVIALLLTVLFLGLLKSIGVDNY